MTILSVAQKAKLNSLSVALFISWAWIAWIVIEHSTILPNNGICYYCQQNLSGTDRRAGRQTDRQANLYVVCVGRRGLQKLHHRA